MYIPPEFIKEMLAKGGRGILVLFLVVAFEMAIYLYRERADKAAAEKAGISLQEYQSKQTWRLLKVAIVTLVVVVGGGCILVLLMHLVRQL